MTTDLIRQQLAQLSETLFLLQCRVRQAVAGEIGEAVANALAEIVTATLAGHPNAGMPYSRTSFSGYPAMSGRSEWDQTEDWDGHTPSHEAHVEQEPAAVKHALMLALFMGSRTMLARQTLTWATLGLGLGTGVAVLFGGPLVRTILSMWWSLERLRTSTDALGDGANVLERV
jgi:hypothetical protein